MACVGDTCMRFNVQSVISVHHAESAVAVGFSGTVHAWGDTMGVCRISGAAPSLADDDCHGSTLVIVHGQGESASSSSYLSCFTSSHSNSAVRQEEEDLSREQANQQCVCGWDVTRIQWLLTPSLLYPVWIVSVTQTCHHYNGFPHYTRHQPIARLEVEIVLHLVIYIMVANGGNL